jgi:DNA-binding CsgD family transcriptional regulator
MKPITPQERNVLNLISKGYSTRMISSILNISFHTVQSHRKSLLTKFDVANSVELVLKAARKKDLLDY